MYKLSRHVKKRFRSRITYASCLCLFVCLVATAQPPRTGKLEGAYVT